MRSPTAKLFSEVVHGAGSDGMAFILNSSDAGLLNSLDRLSAADASRTMNGGASVAAHAEHLRFGLTLMNRWAREGGNPFGDAQWDSAWKMSEVDEKRWAEIRAGLRAECVEWLQALEKPRELTEVQQAMVLSTVAHTAYHVGAIRQIARGARGPREGTFK